MAISAVDLFCGIGGLTRGISNAGISVSSGFDLDETCCYAYEHNNHSEFVPGDISSVKSSVVDSFLEDDLKVIVGCAPCQPFSSNTPKMCSGRNNDKWGMLYHFGRIVRDVKPDIISMENVPNIRTTEPFLDFIKTLIELGYFYSYSVVNCEEYGIPQKRKRLVLLASKLNPIYLKSPDVHSFQTVRDAIGFLPSLNDGETSDSDPLHHCQKLSDLNKKRILHSKPGGSWHDWPDDLILDCHKKNGGKSFSAAYGRMCWDEPSPTITTQFFNYGSGRFGHPEQNRALSLREGALIQTFPMNYEFTPGNEVKSLSMTATHIGNAVPVKLGEVIGKTIFEHVNC